MQGKLGGVRCCDVLDGLINNAGKDDYAVLAKSFGEYRFFVLQSRACRMDEELLFRNVPKEMSLPRPLHLVTQVGIQFCPFCGRSLAELIRENQIEFDRLSEEHYKMVM
jgi:hypothetical protein